MPRGSGMPPTRRRSRTRSGLYATLPEELRSLDAWYYLGGLQDYMRALSRFVGDDQRVTPLMNAAGLSAADWFRYMLSGASERRTAPPP